MNKIPVSLQLWSVHDDTEKDFLKTVQSVARMGYAGVELAGYGNLSAKEAAKAVSDANLLSAGMHVGMDRLRSDLDKVIEEAKLFKSPFITCPWYSPSELDSPSKCEAFGNELDKIGETTRKAGISFSYHNHDFEFKPTDGRLIIDWMLGASEPRNLSFELDVYWSTFAGANTCDFIRKQGGRIRQIHLKDDKELGVSGKIDFKKIFSVVEEIGSTEHYIVEQEEYSHAPMESVALCFEQIRRWGKV